MTNLELSDFFSENKLLCATCGEPMDFLGEWPIQGKLGLRWLCKTCRQPDPDSEEDICVGVSLILPNANLRYEDASSSDLAPA